MSFGYAVGDILLLSQIAWNVVQNSRKACGAHDELTSEVTSLHIVIRRLHLEVSKPNSILSRSDDNLDRRDELAQLSIDCKRVLRVLDGILEKYNALSEEKRSATKLWKRVQFGNGEMLDLVELRQKLTASTSALTLFLNLLSIGSQGKVESYMESQGDELKEMRRSLNWITAEMQAKAPRAGEGSILTTYAGDDKAIWKDFRRELIKDGFSSELLEMHKETIKDYVMELGSRGVLDDLEDDTPNEDMDVAAGKGRECTIGRCEVETSEACLPARSQENPENLVNKPKEAHVPTQQLSHRKQFPFEGDTPKNISDGLGISDSLLGRKRICDLKSISGGNETGHGSHGAIKRQEKFEVGPAVWETSTVETASLHMPAHATDQGAKDKEAGNNVLGGESQQNTELCDSAKNSQENLDEICADGRESQPLSNVHSQRKPTADFGAAPQRGQGGSVSGYERSTIESELLEDQATHPLGDDEVEVTQIGTIEGSGSTSYTVKASDTNSSSDHLRPVDGVQFTYTASIYTTAIDKLLPKWFGPYHPRGRSADSLLFITEDPLFHTGAPFSSRPIEPLGNVYRPHQLCHWIQSLANHYDQAQSSTSTSILLGTPSWFAKDLQLLMGRLCAYHIRIKQTYGNLTLDQRCKFRNIIEAFYLFIRDGMCYMLSRNERLPEIDSAKAFLWLLDDNLGWQQESDEFVTDQAVLGQKEVTRSILQLDTPAALDFVQGLCQRRHNLGTHFSYIKLGEKISFWGDLRLFMVYLKRWMEDDLLLKESRARNTPPFYQINISEYEILDSAVARAVYMLKMCKFALETWSFECDFLYSKIKPKEEQSSGINGRLSTILARYDHAQEELYHARLNRIPMAMIKAVESTRREKTNLDKARAGRRESKKRR